MKQTTKSAVGIPSVEDAELRITLARARLTDKAADIEDAEAAVQAQRNALADVNKRIRDHNGDAGIDVLAEERSTAKARLEAREERQAKAQDARDVAAGEVGLAKAALSAALYEEAKAAYGPALDAIREIINEAGANAAQAMLTLRTNRDTASRLSFAIGRGEGLTLERAAERVLPRGVGPYGDVARVEQAFSLAFRKALDDLRRTGAGKGLPSSGPLSVSLNLPKVAEA